MAHGEIQPHCKDYVEMVPVKTMCSNFESIIDIIFVRHTCHSYLLKLIGLFKFQIYFSLDVMDFHVITLTKYQLEETIVMIPVLVLVVVTELFFYLYLEPGILQLLYLSLHSLL